MAERKTGKELEKIKEKYGATDLFSWSKYNLYKSDPYSYYLKYIKRIKEDRKDGIYAISGGVCHEIVEDFYEKNITHDEMLKKYEEKLFEFNMAELKYDRSDEEKNGKIANKYESCLKHFFINHNRINANVQIEKFITIMVNGILFQGYIDAIHAEKRNDKKYAIITDWKTSSLYQGDKIDKEKGQLVLYAEGIRQKTNIPIENIIIRWNFLKYVEVEYTQSKGDKKTRIILRNEIASKLLSNARMWLKKEKYGDNEVEKILEEMSETNSINCLPNKIKEKFTIRDCYVEIPLTEETINNLKEDITNTVSEIKQKESKYKEAEDDTLFWQEVTDKNSYFFANLSGYSRLLHKPYNEYLNNLEMFKNKEDEEPEDNSWLNELGL